MRLSAISLLLLTPFLSLAQTKKAPVKPRCNPLILGQIPKKALSVQYDFQAAFANPHTVLYEPPATQKQQNRIAGVHGLRVNLNRNVVVKPKLYMSVDAGWWYSRFNVNNNGAASAFSQALNSRAFHSFTASTNIFKPLNLKHFILVNLAVEVNGNSASLSNLGWRNVFGGGAIFYGWKNGLKSMTGIGLLRAYRLGRVVHVPALLLNKNFNKKWGVEMTLPARALIRYAPDKKSFLTAGYELEGGQFGFAAPGTPLHNSFFQRGEIRPKLGYETALGKNGRFTLNAGLRINGRMQWAANYDGKVLLVDNDPDPSLFVNAGLHLMNLKFSKKKKK